MPPEYDEANRQLQPDIAPLPKIKIRSEKPKEGKKYIWHRQFCPLPGGGGACIVFDN